MSREHNARMTVIEGPKKISDFTRQDARKPKRAVKRLFVTNVTGLSQQVLNCVFCRDLHLIRILLCSVLFKKDLFKGGGRLAENFFRTYRLLLLSSYDAFTTVVEEIKFALS